MFLGIVIIATLFGYAVGLIAWIAGAGMLAALGLLVATGVGSTIALTVLLLVRENFQKRFAPAQEYTAF